MAICRLFSHVSTHAAMTTSIALPVLSQKVAQDFHRFKPLHSGTRAITTASAVTASKKFLYVPVRAPRANKKTRVVCISDTHSKHRQIQIPEADILIHAGDITISGEIDALKDFNKWLGELTHVKHKVVIAGNHDYNLDNIHPSVVQKLLNNCIYLQDSSAKVEDLLIYGSPWTPQFESVMAFNLQRGEPLRKIWNLAPQHVDILVCLLSREN